MLGIMVRGFSLVLVGGLMRGRDGLLVLILMLICDLPRQAL